MADYMVNGLDIFAERFKDYTDNFIIVGGTACSLAMTDAGINFRATNDIDMIVIVEELSANFGKTFWNFIKDGGYEFWKSDDTTHLQIRQNNFFSLSIIFLSFLKKNMKNIEMQSKHRSSNV